MSIPTVTIKSGGDEMPGAYQLMYMDVSKEFNKVPIGELRLLDGNVPKSEFEITDSDFFAPGKKIELSIKYEGDPDSEGTVFKGIVVGQALGLDSTGTMLTVELSDEAIKMTNIRNNKVYKEKTDTAIMKALIGDSGLTAGTVADTELEHKQMVQYYATDWDFMVSRAEANGHLVLANDGEVGTIKPKTESPALELELGKDEIFDFDLQASARKQLNEVEALAWNIKDQKVTDPSAGEAFELAQGNYEIEKLAKAVGGAKVQLMHTAEVDPDELKAWAGAQVIKSRLSLLRGWVRIKGDASLKVGDTMKLKGVGDRFSGDALITGLRHQVTTQGWESILQIGQDADWFYQRPKVTDAPAAGLLPGINGLQIGVVEAFEEDPAKEFKVKLKIPAFGAEGGVVWARWSTPDAGEERGFFFRPESGDEVVVGFINDDPRQAIVLGALFSSKNKVPVDVAEENPQKGLFTKKKYQLLFHEEDEKVVLSTSEDNSLTINEADGIIELADANDNIVTMDENGVKITSGKDVELEIKGNLKITAKENIEMKGKKVKIKGDLAVEAESKIEMKGDLSVKANSKIEMKGDLAVKANSKVEIKGTKISLKGSQVEIA